MKQKQITRAQILKLIRKEAKTADSYIFEIHPYYLLYSGDFNKDTMVAPDVVRFLLDELDGKCSPIFSIEQCKIKK